MVRWMTRLLAVMVCVLATAPARAAFHVYRLAEVFSSADGSVQFIRLHCPAGADFQNFWSGLTLTCTDGVTTHTLNFATNLPSTSTGNTDVLIATANFAALPGGVTPDYVIPAGFLFTGGGTVTFAPGNSIPSLVYGALPTNGQSSINAAGAMQTNAPANFAHQTGSVNVPPGSCCVGTTCTISVQVSCTGTFTLGGLCQPNPCAPASGVCCAGATCRVDTPVNCTGGNTVFVSTSACNIAGNTTTPCCRADYNHVNGLSVQDIFDYLAAWFAGAVNADFVGNGAGTPNVQSIFNFLGAWFAGC